jgi:RHS repeat-associated protein
MDSVIRSAQVNGLTYNYYYDGRNHRTRKQYPNGAVDDFFYAPDGRLLSERGFTLDTNSNGNTVDEYVWLGDVPVVMLRSLFNASMVRQTDWGTQTTVCQRKGELGRCGTYFIVADNLGRPAEVVDKNFTLAGVGEYDSFGELNRVPQRAETQHPYVANTNATMATNVGRDKYAYGLPLRGRYSFVDTSTGYQCGKFWCPDDDRSEVREGSTVKASVSGTHYGKAVTAYFETANGRFDVWFQSNAAGQRHGLVFEGYEYQRVSSGGYRVFPPLRFPGQYFDEETGLHENWNRYYDPTTGRYLSPEPMLLRHPADSLLSYAYGANNPTRFVDPNGLWKLGTGTKCQNFKAALQRARIWMGCEGFETASCECRAKKERCFAQCDICNSLRDGTSPTAKPVRKPFADTEAIAADSIILEELWPGTDRASVTTMIGEEYEIKASQCEGANNISALASTLIHEASHHCANLTQSPEFRDEEMLACSAWQVECACVPPGSADKRCKTLRKY